MKQRTHLNDGAVTYVFLMGMCVGVVAGALAVLCGLWCPW